MKRYACVLLLAILFFQCSPKLAPDNNWGRQRWVLSELKGVPVQQSGTNRDAFLEFSPVERRFTGNGGCNRISGNYTIEKSTRIDFGEVLSTKMSCADIAFENTFLSTLNEVDRFESTANSLLLKKGNKVILVLQPK